MPGEHLLLLLRHAKSSWDEGVEDSSRPLNDRGRRDARAVGRILAQRGWRPDLALCSPALRARQTWQEAVEDGAEAAELRFDDRIYAAAPGTLERLVREVPESVGTLAVIGHGPGLPDLAERLAGDATSAAARRMREKYPTTGLAVFSITGTWADLSQAHLVDFVVPR